MKAFIFDLDGVIVDTAKYHYLAWKRLAEELNYQLSEEDNEQLKGVSRVESLNRILKLADKEMSEVEKERLADKKNAWFVEYVSQMTPQEILPGSESLLKNLKARSNKIALASSSKNAKEILKKIRLTHCFDVIVDGTMITHSKPHPEIFLLAAELLHTNPKECLVFEDAEAGVEAAISAGMKCIGVGSRHQLPKASVVVKDLSEVSLEKVNQLIQYADTL